MEALRDALECVLRVACGINRAQDPPTRHWIGVPKAASEDTRLRSERRANIIVLAHRMLDAVEGSDSMDTLMECIQSNEELRDKLLVDYSGKKRVPSQSAKSWIGRLVLVWPFMLAYLARLPEARFDKSVFDSIYEHVSEDIRLLPCRMVRRVCPVSGIQMSMPELVLAPDLRLRAVSPDELETWLNVDDACDRPAGIFELLELGCAIEESFPLDPGDPQSRPPALDRVYLVLNLLRLLKDAGAHIEFIEEKKHRVLFGPGSHLRLTPSLRDSSQVNEKTIDTDDGESLLSAWQHLHIGQESESARKLSFALRRYGGSFDRLSDDDRLVDYWIALECLFADDSNQDTTYRASLRLAAYVEEDPKKRVKVYADAKTSYKFRSAIVHGDDDRLKALCKKHDFHTVVSDAHSWLRKSILRLLEPDECFDASKIEECLLSRSAKANCSATRRAGFS